MNRHQTGQLEKADGAHPRSSTPISSTSPLPPVVYGELSILGYNGYIPNGERSGRRNKSKYLLCKRPTPNGIKKSRHYIVKQPQATKAIQDKDLHSISYTFSRSQTIIVEYKQDETTDMFQIGRSSEDPIDFVVMDTLSSGSNNLTDPSAPSGSGHHQCRKHQGSSAAAPSSSTRYSDQQQLINMTRFHKHLAKVGEEMLQYGFSPSMHDSQDSRYQFLVNYPPPNVTNLPPIIANHYQYQDLASQQYLGQANQRNRRSHTTQSTISRFACRVLVDREPPYTARIYAAGFDSSKNIFLGEKATKWEQDNSIDGLTTNGVLLMHPKRVDCDKQPIQGNSGLMNGPAGSNSDSAVTRKTNSNEHDVDMMLNSSGSNFEYAGVWREVSVDGGIYAIRESRSAAQKGRRIEKETNILQDGTLIDLCGATLLWRSLEGFKSSPTKKTLEDKIDMLNATRPQCPVGLNTLVIPRKPTLRNDKSCQQPYVYVNCGHVQGYHDWGISAGGQRTCPICRTVSTVAKLGMGLEPSFYVDSGPLTHVFNPCGHMASERTVKYWCSIKIPHGTHFFQSICPFCATPLTTDGSASTRLIFQGDFD